MKDDLKNQLNEYKRYKYIIENIKDIIWEMSGDFIYTFVSPNAKNMTGYEVEELIGRKMIDFLAEESRKYVLDRSRQQINKRLNRDAEEIVLYDVQFRCKEGSFKWFEVSMQPNFEAGRFIGYIGTTRDITEKKEYECQLKKYISELKLTNAKLEQMATVDVLTGAFNRRKFDDDLNSIIRCGKDQDIPFSLIFLDIDHFKMINDRHGHKTGDFVLQSISRLIRENVRSTDRLFRWGGEEFILILPDANLDSAICVAEKIRIIIQDYDFAIGERITISLGVGEYKFNEDIDQIIVRIDNALLKAKTRGRNRVAAC